MGNKFSVNRELAKLNLYFQLDNTGFLYGSVQGESFKSPVKIINGLVDIHISDFISAADRKSGKTEITLSRRPNLT